MNRFEDMALFVRVVEAGSFSAAAQRSGLSKSLVSRRIAALEDRLSARLLNRTTRRLALTETGAAFFERCQRILAEVDEAEALTHRLDAEPRGTLRVAAPMSFGVRHLAPALAAFMKLHPGLSVELDLNDRFVDLASEGHDMAVRIGRLPDSPLMVRRLAPCRAVVVASPDYLARRGEPRGPDGLADHDLVVYSNRSIAEQWAFLGVTERFAGRLKPRLSVNNGEVQCEAAAAGLGLAAVPSFIAAPWLEQGTLRTVLIAHPIGPTAIYAVYLPNRHLAAKVRRFIDFLVERFGGEPYWDRCCFPRSPA